MVHGQTAPFLIQLSINIPAKEMEDGPKAWVATSLCEFQKKHQAHSSGLAQPPNAAFGE